MTEQTNFATLVSECESLLSEVFVGTLRALRDKVATGKLSANDISSITKFLSANGISLGSLKESTDDDQEQLAREIEGLELDFDDDDRLVPFVKVPASQQNRK